MSASADPLWQADVLVLACARSSAGQTTELRRADGATVATSDGSGTISDAASAVLLQARTTRSSTPRARRRGSCSWHRALRHQALLVAAENMKAND